MDKRFWGIVAAIAVIFIGIIIFNNNKAEAPDGSQKASLTSHTLGEGSSGVRLVEYGDFQCPACAQYDPIVKEVVERYGEQITFQFRNFPLISIHPNAVAAARAAEAADMQDKYWQMHSLLFQNQNSWGSASDPLPTFVSYAKQLELDEAKFREDFKSRVSNDRIQADIQEGTRLDVNSTPTFFIDGKKISNPDASVEAFSKVIENAIEKKTGKKPDVSGSNQSGQDGTQPVTTPENGTDSSGQ